MCFGSQSRKGSLASAVDCLDEILYVISAKRQTEGPRLEEMNSRHDHIAVRTHDLTNLDDHMWQVLSDASVFRSTELTWARIFCRECEG